MFCVVTGRRIAEAEMQVFLSLVSLINFLDILYSSVNKDRFYKTIAAIETEQKLRTHARKLITLSSLITLQHIAKLGNT